MFKETIHFIIDMPIEFNCFEWLVSIITTLGFIYLLRPKIVVKELILCLDKEKLSKIKIPVFNNSCFFAATNVIIEAALIANNQSFHFKLDRNEFILIPKKCCLCSAKPSLRNFQIIDFEIITREIMGTNKEINFTSLLNEKLKEGTTLRVRIHANHEFTNFGKAFEYNFIYQNKTFIKI